MTTKEFIEKAVEGGYDGYTKPFCIECGNYEAKNGGDLFLDPKAWEAVGSVEGWTIDSPLLDGGLLYEACYPEGAIEFELDGYKSKMYEMIDHLIEGGSITSYLETL